ncbi:ATP-dependent helicase rhp16 [Helianthus annuus]|nr:ATP-dependent helicase rhp16 [Helianthus annuus]
MEISDDENDGRLPLDFDMNESIHEGLDNAKVDEPERTEIDEETFRGWDMLQLFENKVELGRDDLDKEDALKNKQEDTKPTLMWKVWEDENEKWLDHHRPENINSEHSDATADPSPDFVMTLLRYQKEWLAWGLKQEESASRGGILADEMGMGKTVQAIALVLAKRALCRELDEPRVKTTLVICPLIAVMQWVDEIDRCTTKGSNKVLAYHGPNRGKTLIEFSTYDFVITTYSIVESEYRKNFMPPKESCEKCGKKFYANSLKIHVARFCNGIKTVKQSKQSKTAKVDDKNNKKGLSTFLHSVKWTRIILDEAHYIKDKYGSTARAVFALESSYRWALSGTPLQNHVGELYSLVHFLQITPYSYHFCRDCDCKVLEHTKDFSCPHCPHSSNRHFSWWNKYIALPIARNDGSGRVRGTHLLKDKVLKCIMLRRTKKGRAADLTLPPRIISVRRDYLDSTEKDYYMSLKKDSQGQVNRYVEEGTLMSNYGHIFSLLTRLRQAADHPYLVMYSKYAVGRTSNSKYSDERFCGLCHDATEDPVVTSCEHLFCKSCLTEFSASFGQPACPSCSKPLTIDFSESHNDQEIQKAKSSLKGFKPSSILNRIRLENFQTSTKIDALKEEIRCMFERDGSAKGIVFSQFTTFLDLIHYSLQKSGVKCVQLDGSMTLDAREAAITRFINDGDCRIFLMSLKAGGVALNLTVASHVFLMDPWWNPAVEQQAQDRVYRIGQYKPIRVVKFVIEDTIEKDILEMQEKRKLGFEGTVGGRNEALEKLSHNDLMQLFLHV